MRVAELKARLLSVVRRGPRQVLWVPDNVNLGNFLYHWLRAHRDQTSGLDVRARTSAAMRPWLEAIPQASRLVVAPEEVRFGDLRVMGMHQDWGVDYDGETLHRFVREILLPSGALHEHPATELGVDDLVINVRRGDYYSHPVHFQTYGFDQSDYIRQAVELSLQVGGPIPRIHLVTDGLTWCRETLGWLQDYTDSLTFCEPGESARENFATIASARRIALTNSTFGYWAAYVANVLHADQGADNRNQVVAPWFHARIGDGKAEQLDPGWHTIRDPRWELPPNPTWGVPE